MVKIVTQDCFLCGQTGSVELTDDQAARLNTGKIQDVLPDVPAEVREQLISGTHPGCWDEAFGDEEEE